ncbi:MAG: type II toxin-antitoxin system VapC family toxin [Deltaproteobacteria bacterium]|nr:type II toxin-antitoxin system VapC family toxin [Deltaproteobacteria bacterium]
MKNIVFDSHAILKFYQDEDGSDMVEDLLVSAKQGKIKAFMSEINLGEIYYQTIRRLGLKLARNYLEQFYTLPLKIISPSPEIILSASEIKAEYAISYADCFAVATALQFSASIITGDPEFKKVEHLVKIRWI